LRALAEAGKPTIKTFGDEAELGLLREAFLDGLLPAYESEGFGGPELGQREHRPQQVWQVISRPIRDLQDSGRSKRRPVGPALPDVISQRTGLVIGTWKRHSITIVADVDTLLRFHRYDRLAPSPRVVDLLQEVDREPVAIFWR
jgi:Protein of unknown function (DUF3024)